jgi:hypothetical protein
VTYRVTMNRLEKALNTYVANGHDPYVGPSGVMLIETSGDCSWGACSKCEVELWVCEHIKPVDVGVCPG